MQMLEKRLMVSSFTFNHNLALSSKHTAYRLWVKLESRKVWCLVLTAVLILLIET